MLTKHLLGLINQQLSKNIKHISKPAMESLLDYHWPGNVRELKHVLEYACVMCEGETINTRHLPSDLLSPPLDAEAIARKGFVDSTEEVGAKQNSHRDH